MHQNETMNSMPVTEGFVLESLYPSFAFHNFTPTYFVQSGVNYNVLKHLCCADLGWQPRVSKRGRNITRPARHSYAVNMHISSDEEQDGVKPPKRSRRGIGQRPSGSWITTRNAGHSSLAKPLTAKSPAQVGEQCCVSSLMIELLFFCMTKCKLCIHSCLRLLFKFAS